MTNHVPAFRAGAFAKLDDRERVVFALISGALRHGGVVDSRQGLSTEPPHGLNIVRPTQRGVARLAASGRFRAVVAGLSGRLAPAAAYAGARAARVPFVLWATMWSHPRTPAHALTYLPVGHLYRHADAIATYGPHVSDYVRGRGARSPVVVAPQSVDDAFWSTPVAPRRLGSFQALFAGRLETEKGLGVLLAAWRSMPRDALPPGSKLIIAGDGSGADRANCAPQAGVVWVGRQSPRELRQLYAGSDVLVMPSVRTRDFLEPWGLSVNEAFNQGVPVIASEAVGAVAGGLVVHERAGLVVPEADPVALAAALERLARERNLRERLGEGTRAALVGHSHADWAAGMSEALAHVGVSRAVVA